MRVIYDDPAYDVIGEYPDSAVEYCLVKNEHIASGRNAHWYALMWASRVLFFDGEEQIWNYDCGGANGKQIAADAFFAAANEKRGSNYRGAFLYPPHGGWLVDSDFDRVNAALFPNGTDGLEFLSGRPTGLSFSMTVTSGGARCVLPCTTKRSTDLR